MIYIIIVVIVLVVLAYGISKYNGLVTLKQRTENGWAQIDVQLKQRADLIPNIVETVKGYAKHEAGTLEKVIQARNMATNAVGVDATADANNQLTGALKTLFAVAEAYPDLKANQNFLDLQVTLKGIEEKIAYSRQFYNDIVTRYNTAILVFPGNIIANLFKFKEAKLFNIVEAEREVPKVNF